MKRLLFLFFVLASTAAAQGVRFSSTVQQQGSVQGPAGVLTNAVLLPASPVVAFCNHPANAVPCTNKATTYTDQTLTTPCSTSTQIVRDGTTTCVASPDAQNNWGVWVAPNSAGYDYTITLTGGVNLGPFNVLSQTTTLTGTTPATGLNACIVNGVFYVGGSTCWAGSDLFAQQNTVYAAASPLSGSVAGKMVVNPTNNGTAYVVATQFTEGVNGKCMSVDWGGVTVNASSMTSTTPIVIDCGQGNVSGNPLFQNLHLNGPCATTACTGVTSSGMDWGPTNGLVNATFQNIQIGTTGSGTGFLNGIFIHSGNSFLDYCFSCLIARNNTGVNVTAGGGGGIFTGGSISQNATGWNIAGAGSGKAMVAMEFDDNTTTAINRASTASTNDECTNCRFENAGLGSLTVLTDNVSTGSFTFTGGTVLDDVNSGTTPQYISMASANNVNSSTLVTRGLKFASAGRAATQAIFLGNSTYDLDVVYSGTPPTALYNTNLTGAVRYSTDGGTGPTRVAIGTSLYLTEFGTLDVGSSATNGFHFIPAATVALRNVNLLETFQANVDLAFLNHGTYSTGHLPNFAGTNGILQDAGLSTPTAAGNATVTQTIANGTAAMTTALIAAGACGTTVTVAATGVVTTDIINVSRNAAVTAANGGVLTLNWWPTSANVNFNYCNPTAAGVTPTATTLNWSVTR